MEKSSNNSGGRSRPHKGRARNSRQNHGGKARSGEMQARRKGGGGRPHNRPPHASNGGGKKMIRHKKRLSRKEAIYRKYLLLLEQHIHARRKYYDRFFAQDERAVEKAKRNFYTALDNLRRFEKYLSPEDRKLLSKYTDPYSWDSTYSSNHHLPSSGEDIAREESFDDPHLLESQKNASFSSDSEESEGTLEDYQKYKGL